jgi:6-phosphogluconate dehydrogenase
MKIGMVGLGRMGANMALRLMKGGHQLAVFDSGADARNALAAKGAQAAPSLAALVTALPTPRTAWIMVPPGEATEATLTELHGLLAKGDSIIEGGNSNYKDTQRRAKSFEARGIHYIDCGTSGGVWGLENGYSLMVGGDAAAIERLRPVFETLAPAKDKGWGRVGPSGAGHFTKMVHNGIEYGLMQAYAEGFAILEKKGDLDLDLHQVAGIWQHGSVVRSWLLDLTAAALKDNPGLEGIAPHVSDSGEGRWTVQEAIDLDVAAPVITLSLLERLGSREENSFADRLLAAMRNQFGGHAIKKR